MLELSAPAEPGRQADMHYLCRGACGGISARALCAVLLSIISLKPLFTAFLEIRHDSLDWLIFHVEPLNILLHLLVFFVALALSLGISLHSYSRKSARVLLNDTESEKALRRARKPLLRRSSPAATLCALWHSRTTAASAHVSGCPFR